MLDIQDLNKVKDGEFTVSVDKLFNCGIVFGKMIVYKSSYYVTEVKILRWMLYI